MNADTFVLCLFLEYVILFLVDKNVNNFQVAKVQR